MPARKKSAKSAKKDSTAHLSFEAKLWLAADKLRNNMDAAEPSGASWTTLGSPEGSRGGSNQYKHVVVGLIFLKYISDSFEAHHAKLVAGSTRASRVGSGAPADPSLDQYAGADPEDPDEYKAENIFWVPQEARWSHLQGRAKLPSIGKDVDDAMDAIERDNPRLKGALNKNYGRPDLDKHRLGELIDLIGSIELGAKRSGDHWSPNSRKAKTATSDRRHDFDILGRVFEWSGATWTTTGSPEGSRGGANQFYTPSCVVRLLVGMLASTYFAFLPVLKEPIQ